MRPVARLTLVCAGCGRKFQKRVTEIGNNKSGRHFCGIDCLRAVGPKPRKGKEYPCRQCGTPVYRSPSGVPKSGQVFCSHECHSLFETAPGGLFKCEICSTIYRLKPSQVVNQAGRFCSKPCESTARIKRPLTRFHNGRPAVLDNHGYVRIYEPDHPKAMHGGWVFEHRHVVERRIGRILEQHEHVHHLDGEKDNNRSSNLVIMDGLSHLLHEGRTHRARLRAVEAELEQYRTEFGPLTPKSKRKKN